MNHRENWKLHLLSSDLLFNIVQKQLLLFNKARIRADKLLSKTII